MRQRIIPAIMSGGAGVRLWPVSTSAMPKQFHALGGDASLFAQTLLRVSGDVGGLSFAAPIVLANEEHAELVRQHLSGASATIVLEPIARNTAVIAAVAAVLAEKADPEALLLLLPADHLVSKVGAFHAALEHAAPYARDRIVTFGITPDRPATGYGYIKLGGELGPGVFAIESFREKPDDATARGYLAQGGYLWNSGMFLADPRTLLAEFDARPDIRERAREALSKARRSGAEVHLDAAAFAEAPSLPFDVAVMEKTQRGAVALCSIGWADVGSWDEIWRLSPKDGGGNVVVGPVAAINAANTLLRSEGVKLCVAGVSDLIVVATPEAVIIVPRERAQDVKQLRDLADKL
jgi:mannose-1-phosphate guanylyltransferase/mannose-6-phosphate isomerase